MIDKRYFLHQWNVPSQTCPRKSYRVSLRTNGNYICTCSKNTFQRIECDHIREVQKGNVTPEPEPVVVHLPETGPKNGCTDPPFEYADVLCVTKRKNGRVYIPPTPSGDIHFMVTVVYDLLHSGFSITSKRIGMYGFEPGQEQTIDRYIKKNGRKVRSPFGGFKVLPIAQEEGR